MSRHSNKEIKERMKKQLNDDQFLTAINRKSFDQADKNKKSDKPSTDNIDTNNSANQKEKSD